MKIIRVIGGCACFCLILLAPIRSSLITAIAHYYRLNPQDQMVLFSQATEIDPCETNNLNALGDLYIAAGNGTMAAFEYGRAMICSPGNSLMRYKFGEALLSMGFDGRDNLLDAMRLEPNNPAYREEYRRINMVLQLQSPSR